MLLALITSVSTILMPKMSQLRMNKENDKKVAQLLKVSLDYTLIIALLFTALLMVSSAEFVPWFYGNEYRPMINNMFWVSLIMIFIAYGGVLSSQFTLVNGDYKKYSIPSNRGCLF